MLRLTLSLPYAHRPINLNLRTVLYKLETRQMSFRRKYYENYKLTNY